MKGIIVVGSLNVDLVQAVPRLPGPGETISAADLQIVPGGKGANQACAAGRLGAPTFMIGHVGSDRFADLLVGSLQGANVDRRYVSPVASASGAACILVQPNGQNSIVVSPGANGRLSADFVARAVTELIRECRDGAAVLCQLEVPMEATRAALQTAREKGAISLLDPAPAQTLSPELLARAEYLTPNQTEAAFLLGRSEPLQSIDEAATAAQQLLSFGTGNVLLKMGELGCMIANQAGCQHVPAFKVSARDTTAAGDTFNGAFATALLEGASPHDAVRFASAAAAISVSRTGAQSSIPTRAETDAFMNAQADGQGT